MERRLALYPKQRPLFDARLADAGLADAGLAAGQAYGVAVAHAMLASRTGDPGVGDAGHIASTAPGSHRSDPDNSPQPFYGAFYGGARCFASNARHRLDPPPVLNGPE